MDEELLRRNSEAAALQHAMRFTYLIPSLLPVIASNAGKCVQHAGDGCGICIVETGGELLFAADMRGTVHVMRWQQKHGVLQAPHLLSRFPAVGLPCEPTTLSFLPWASLAGGPALLVASADHLLAVLR